MSTNPYQVFSQDPQSPEGQRWLLQRDVNLPAVALMVVAGICIGLLTIAIPFDVLLLLSGVGARLNRGGMDPNVRIGIRLVWSLLLVGASCYVFWGGLQMKRLANFGHAHAAAIIACIPCVGPCCLLGIPFGIWAIAVLSKPEVRKSFES